MYSSDAYRRTHIVYRRVHKREHSFNAAFEVVCFEPFVHIDEKLSMKQKHIVCML